MSLGESQLKQQFPAVYVTLISIIVALAVERLFSRLGSFGMPLGGDGAALLVWLQAFAVFQLAVCMWFLASLFVITFRWVLRFSDSVGPFALLFLLNLLISSIGAETAHHWLYLAGVGSFTSAGVFSASLRKAAREPENRERLDRRRFIPAVVATIALGGLMLGFGLLVHIGVFGIRWASVGVVAFCLGLGVAVWLWHRAWRQSLGLEDER